MLDFLKNIKIPIYSKLKIKLESKGLDSTSSGQIAWFVCSVGMCFIIFAFLFLFSLGSFIDSLDSFVSYLRNNTIGFLCLAAFSIFIFNLFYIKNILPLSLVIFFIDFAFYFWAIF